MRPIFAALFCLFVIASGASHGYSQDLFGGDDNLFGLSDIGKESSKPTMTSTLKADPSQPNIVLLEISLKIPEGSYAYSMNPSFGAATKVTFSQLEGLAETSDGFKPDHPPKVVYDDVFEQNLEKFTEQVTWTKKFQVLPGKTDVSVKGNVNFQVCDESACRTYDQEFEAKLTVTPGDTMEKSVEAVSFDGKVEINPKSVVKSLDELPVKFSVMLKSVEANKFLLAVTAKVGPGYHIFATTQDPAMVGLPTTFGTLTLNGLKTVDGVFSPNEPCHELQPFDDDPSIVQKVHEGTVIWTTWLTKDPGVKVDQVGVSGSVSFQVCDDVKCVNGAIDFQVGETKSASVVAPTETVTQTPTTEETVAQVDEESEEPMEGETKALGADGLISFLITAFVAGLLALLTPCVFPMIPVTVSFFLKKAEKKQGNPIVLASVYCLGIMGGFTILGVVMAVFFGATALTALANNAWLNIALSVFLIFFAFNLLGMFEIRVPSWMLNFSAQREGSGGIMGVLFMALTFTLVSFTCTFGFVGLLLVYASKGNLFWPILGMLSFSFAFALPFFFLALFPSYLASLPKSGGWMNNVKVILGIVEIGFAFKFLSVADLAWNPEPYFFDYGLVMSAWMVLSMVAGFYLLGMFRLPHDMPTQQISVFKFAIALSFIGFGTYLAQGIFAAKKPTGFVWQQIEAFAPPVFEFEVLPASHGVASPEVPSDLGPYLVHHGLEFALDYEAASAYAKAQGKPMLLDFTGVNCVNCRKMEKSVLIKPQVMELLPKFVRVQLFTDTDAIPGIDDKTKGAQLRQLNQKLQEEWFGDVSLPAYVVVSPDGKILSRLAGYNADPQVFVNFIERGLARWETKDVAMREAAVR